MALYVSATVRDNLRLFAALAGLRGRALRRAVDQVAEELQLADVLGQRVGLLSGGQRRRTQAAAALVGGAPLLLLDEPTAGADPDTRAAADGTPPSSTLPASSRTSTTAWAS